jgi:glycosyltransferase involved in cell wall biosynthesis
VSHFAIVGSRGYPNYYGGFETLVRHLAPYLAEEGHDVTVYSRAHASRLLQYRIATADVDEIEPPGPGAGKIRVRATGGWDRKSLSTLSFGWTSSIDLAKRGCDAALVLNVANGFFLPRLARAGIPTCVNVDGIEWIRGKWGPTGQRVFRRGAALTGKHADAIIVDSEALSAVWKEEFQRDGVFIPYGAPVLGDLDTDALRAAELPSGGYVLVVARIVPENNVDLLLDAVELMPERPEVIVVGAGNYEHSTVTRLRELGTQGKVRWLGHISDQNLLDQLWTHAGVYWHGHSVGGTNPALLQALGAGAPTLALRTPFNAEVIRSEAQLIDPDPKQLAASLQEILDTPALSSEFSTHGKNVVHQHYRWPETCARYEALLSGLVGTRPGKHSH